MNNADYGKGIAKDRLENHLLSEIFRNFIM